MIIFKNLLSERSAVERDDIWHHQTDKAHAEQILANGFPASRNVIWLSKYPIGTWGGRFGDISLELKIPLQNLHIVDIRDDSNYMAFEHSLTKQFGFQIASSIMFSMLQGKGTYENDILTIDDNAIGNIDGVMDIVSGYGTILRLYNIQKLNSSMKIVNSSS